jgi:hypothetical protein
MTPVAITLCYRNMPNTELGGLQQHTHCSLCSRAMPVRSPAITHGDIGQMQGFMWQHWIMHECEQYLHTVYTWYDRPQNHASQQRLQRRCHADHQQPIHVLQIE